MKYILINTDFEIIAKLYTFLGGERLYIWNKKWNDRDMHFLLGLMIFNYLIIFSFFFHYSFIVFVYIDSYFEIFLCEMPWENFERNSN